MKVDSGATPDMDADCGGRASLDGRETNRNVSAVSVVATVSESNLGGIAAIDLAMLVGSIEPTEKMSGGYYSCPKCGHKNATDEVTRSEENGTNVLSVTEILGYVVPRENHHSDDGVHSTMKTTTKVVDTKK